jgi:hypothetical protein
VFRQSADYYCEDVFTASTSNFAHTIKEVTGGVLFRIAGPGGSVAGYDASTNWLNTSQAGQAGNVAWLFSNYLS